MWVTECLPREILICVCCGSASSSSASLSSAAAAEKNESRVRQLHTIDRCWQKPVCRLCRLPQPYMILHKQFLNKIFKIFLRKVQNGLGPSHSPCKHVRCQSLGPCKHWIVTRFPEVFILEWGTSSISGHPCTEMTSLRVNNKHFRCMPYMF